MKLAPIEWKANLEKLPDAKGNKVYNYEGYVNGQIMFLIDRRNIKVPSYVLKSYPFSNDVFTRANNYKILFEDTNPEKVKRVAEVKLMNFISMFTIPGAVSFDLSYSEAFDKPWDNIEIERCRTEFDGTTYPIHDEKDVQPDDFWSVYVHREEGGVMCIADVPNEETANQLRDMLACAVKTYKDNGHLK